MEKLPRRAADTNKGSYGTVAAFAGSISYRGAPVLAAEGALRCGAGLVFLATVPEAMQLALSRSPECCVLPCRAGGDGCLLPEDVQTIYEGITSDWRSQLNLLVQTINATSKSGYTSRKYNQTSAFSYYGNRVPLIRLPEMYYIAAECYATGATPNLDLAMERLNTVREKRGIYTPLENLDAEGVMEEIAKEYRKEFLAEGVMFYFYKRLGYTTIPHLTETMDDAKYVVPYPDFEVQMGRVQ